MLELEWLFRIFLVCFWIGLVIFVHELGHFLAARWCGVLVERFSIGFGPIILSIKRGDTEYALSAIPLGGYVKMLGQTDTPEVEEASEDPRSYQNRPVGQRMLIISAGVIMNILLAFVLFVIAYDLGVPVIPAEVGSARPGMPAWVAGLRSGDQISEINGKSPTDFRMLLLEVALTHPKRESILLTIDRDGESFERDIQPRQEQLRPQIGVGPPEGLILDREVVAWPKSAGSQAQPPLMPSDTVRAVNGQPVQNAFEFADRMYEYADQAVELTVDRRTGDESNDVLVTVPPARLRSLGMEMDIGEVVAVQMDSPATQGVDEEGNPASIEIDDRIVEVDGEPISDPLLLPILVSERGRKGEPVVLTVARRGKTEQRLKLTFQPVDLPPWLDMPHPMPMRGELRAMSIPSLGVAYKVWNTVHRVVDDSPAAKAGVQAKDEITQVAITFQLPKPDGGNTSRVLEYQMTEANWPDVFWSIQNSSVTSIQFGGKRATGEEYEATLIPEDTDIPLAHRGLIFETARVERVASSIQDALAIGVERTRVSILQMYLTLRGLAMRSISPMNLSGPISIATVTYQLTAERWALLFEFLALININLAIINFLPIPILDGGHMVFLLYEAIARRQANEKVMLAANYLGLLFIAALMLFVIGLDVYRQVAGAWF